MVTLSNARPLGRARGGAEGAKRTEKSKPSRGWASWKTSLETLRKFLRRSPEGNSEDF